MGFDIINVTEAAAVRVKEIIENADDAVIGVRVGVKNAGCAGMAYTLDNVTTPEEGDDHISARGVEVYIDPKATLFLLGTTMDFEVGKMSSGFTFKNPNQTGECGCGESVILKPADLKELAQARSAE
jgi:iron-sulfur cluster assembly protein